MMSSQPEHIPREWRQLLLDQIGTGEKKIEELSDEELEIVVGRSMQAPDFHNARIKPQVTDSRTMSPDEPNG